MSSSTTVCSGCKQSFPLKNAEYLAERALGIPSSQVFTLCPICSTQAKASGLQTHKTPQDALKHAKSLPMPKGNPAQINPMNPTIGNKAVCPRCGEIYDIQQPILRCKECDLEIGKLNDDNEIEWNEKMSEPFPDWLNTVTSPDELFAKVLRWYFDKWVRPFKDNPSHRIGKVKK